MPRWTVLGAAALALGLAVAAAPGQTPAPAGAPAPRFQEWLKLAAPIATAKEMEVFRELGTDRERDVFVDAFWKVRDPTPGTPANEFREEHRRRFAEADRRYGGSGGREGWRTDRGRIYILLGQPASIEALPGTSETVPVEMWSYFGDTAKGQPAHFVLVFYQRGGAGELRLYDPLADGPARLLVNASTRFDAADYESMYRRLYDAQPDLALVSLSIVPGQIPYGYQPALETQVQMTAILEAPRKAVRDGYATHFLNTRGMVSTEYLTRELECAAATALAFDPVTGLPFVHFAAAPARLSLDRYDAKNEYVCDFQVDVSLRTGNQIVLQYSKDFPINIPSDKLAETEAKGVALQDFLPVLEGRSKLTVLLRNTVGKEFAVIEADLDVPASGPRLTDPMIGYKESEGRADAFLPFQAGDRRLHVDPKMTFAAGEDVFALAQAVGLTPDLRASGSVRAVLSGSRASSPVRREQTLALKDLLGKAVINLPLAWMGAGLTPDYYDLSLTLLDGAGKVLDARAGHFVVVAAPAVARPIAYAKTTVRAGEFLFYYQLARQYEKIGAGDRAESLYARAYGLNPGYAAMLPDYAAFLIGRGKSEAALAVLATLKSDEGRAFDYHRLRGRALLKAGRWAEAASAFEAANRIYDSDASVLNDLGRCYDRLGRAAEARAAWDASLKLNPDQPEIRALRDGPSRKGGAAAA